MTELCGFPITFTENESPPIKEIVLGNWDSMVICKVVCSCGWTALVRKSELPDLLCPVCEGAKG